MMILKKLKTAFRYLAIAVPAIAAALQPLEPSDAHSEELPVEDYNFAYSTWVGTGYYRVGGRRVYILRGQLSYTWLEPNEDRKWQLDLLIPGTIGFYQLPKGFDDVGAVTFVPGLMMIYPVKENWRLKPFGQLGFGTAFPEGDSVLITGAGIKSLAVFPWEKGIDFELGNAITWADNTGSGRNDRDNGFSMFEIGLNGRWPISYKVMDRKTDLNLFFIYTEFLNDLNFFTADFKDERIRRLYKIGFALTSKEKFSIFGIEFDGGGLEFSFGKNYYGIGWNTGFPF